MNPAGLNLSNFTTFDWFLIVLLTASVVRAFLRGLVLEVFSLVGSVAGILLASWNYDLLAARLVQWLRPWTTISFVVADIVAFLGIVMAVMVLAGLAGKLIRSGASAIGLGLLDRFLGATFGFARGCLLGVACLMVVTAFDPSVGIIRNSQLLPYFLAGARGVSFVVPGTLQRRLADGADRIKHTRSLWIKPPQ